MVRAKSPKPKPEGVIRQSQLLTAFGPGSMVDLPNRAVIIGGLDYWGGRGEPPRDSKQILEPRLTEKLQAILGVDSLSLFTPPQEVDDPTGRVSGIEAFEFPEWFITKKSIGTPGGRFGRSRILLHKLKISNGRYPHEGIKYDVVPVRFVAACRAGHLQDIRWDYFVHQGQSCGRDLWIDERGTSGDLSEVKIRCDCGIERDLTHAKKEGVLGMCTGKRPWLKDSESGCDEKLRLLVRAASNAYFAERMSVISLPEGDDELRNIVADLHTYIGHVTTTADLGPLRNIPAVKTKLAPYSDQQVVTALDRQRGNGAPGVPVKWAEFEVLASAKEGRDDNSKSTYYAQTLPRDSAWPTAARSIEQVVLVHRLTEVTAQVGFTRFDASSPDVNGELDAQVKRAAISKELSWLPAIQNRGEGFFIQLKLEDVERWAASPKVINYTRRMAQAFDHWKHDNPHSRREHPGIEYMLLHSLSHMFITVLSLRCGYPASSIRERIYALQGQGYGVLLFTGSVDAEGTLGGLVEQGRRFGDLLRAALEGATLCSNDPVCAQHDPSSGHTGRLLHGAACHGCLLVSETSCEQRNEFLDRSLVVPTVERHDVEFFTAE